MITFSSALILFAITLTVLFTALLIITHNRRDKEIRIISEGTGKTMLKAALILSIILLALVLATNIKRSYPQYYYALVAIDAALLVTPITAMSDEKKLTALALPTIFILQVSLLNTQLPPTGVGGGEGDEMDRGMYLTGHWSFSFAHNSAYNPFPAQVYQVVALGKVMGLEWFSALLGGFWYTIFIIVFDLLIYVITLYLVHDVRAALIAVLFINVTPEASLTLNPHLWLSAFLVFLAIITALKSVESKYPMGYAAISVISYVTAMLSLTTAILIILIMIFLFLAIYTLPKLRLYQPTANKNHNMHVLTILFTSYTVISILVMAYTEGYLQYVYPIIQGFINGLIMKLQSLLIQPQTPTSIGPEHPMLYASANPTLAYAWSLALSVATAYLLYVITVKRRESPWIIGFLLTGIIVPVLAALQMLFFRGGLPINVNAYTAIPLIFPAVGLAMSKLRNKGLPMLALLTVLLIALVFVGAHDPNVNPVEYAAIHKVNMPPLPKSVYEASMSAASFLSNDIGGLYVYSPIMGTVNWYNPAVGNVGGYPSNVGVSGLSLALFILNKTYMGNIYVITNVTRDDVYYFAFNYTTFPPGIAYIPLDKYDTLYSSNYFTIYIDVK
jgi:MFS family permease